MLKQYLTVILAVFVINLFFGGPAMAQTKKEIKEAKFAAKVKDGIAKLGTGPDARVHLKIKYRMTLDGYISQINEDSFEVTNEKTGIKTEVQYEQVSKLNGVNLPKGVKIAIYAGVIFGALLLLALICYAVSGCDE